MTAPILETRRRGRQGAARVLAIPGLIFLASIAGLVLGLAGDGIPDLLAWLLLLLPILAAAAAWVRRT